jgi:hypothetical protein
MHLIRMQQSPWRAPCPVVVVPHRPSCSVFPLVDRRRPSTSRPVVIVFHVVTTRCPAAAIVSTRSRWSFTDSPEQHCQGGGGSHPSSFVVLNTLLVVFVVVEEINVVDASSPSHSSACRPAVAVAAAVAIAIVAPQPLQGLAPPPHGILPSVGPPNEYDDDVGIATRAEGGRRLLSALNRFAARPHRNLSLVL